MGRDAQQFARRKVTLERMYERFAQRARRKYGGKETEAAWARYVERCEAHVTPPQPVTEEKICGFLLGECLRGIGSQTLTSRVSRLLRFLDEHPEVDHAPAVASAGARREYARLIVQLQKEFPGEVRRKRVLTDDDLRRIKKYLQPFLDKDGLYAHGLWTLLLLNGAVGCRNKHMRGRAFTWSQIRTARLGGGSATLVLDLPYKKARKGLRDGQFDRVPVPRRAPADRDLDAVRAMRRYAALCGVGLGRSDSRDSVFPSRYKADGRPTDPLYRDCSYEWMRAALLDVLEKAGFPEPMEYGLHSLRRTSATRMLKLGVDGYTVMRICGWASVRSLSIYDDRCVELADEVSAAELRAAERRASGGLDTPRFGLRVGDAPSVRRR